MLGMGLVEEGPGVGAVQRVALGGRRALPTSRAHWDTEGLHVSLVLLHREGEQFGTVLFGSILCFGTVLLRQHFLNAERSISGSILCLWSVPLLQQHFVFWNDPFAAAFSVLELPFCSRSSCFEMVLLPQHFVFWNSPFAAAFFDGPCRQYFVFWKGPF